ncbi:hypothetical protein Pa4123_00070 [Phytohabitans aurantiacus]|uniref:Uncharacterized protein n=1 Tax=Phytohabitans aurantiacus TaxID=3016789 RepID=A0ABQ5QJP1_9ACTN|nr:hypothetical protein Pa4123_00070 [Phytohabitans aurantiacus]
MRGMRGMRGVRGGRCQIAAAARRSRAIAWIKGKCTREEIQSRAFALDRRARRGDTPCRAGLGADVRGEEIQSRAFGLDRREACGVWRRVVTGGQQRRSRAIAWIKGKRTRK